MTTPHPPLAITDFEDVTGPGDLFALMCQRRGWDPERLAQLERPVAGQLRDMDTLVTALHRIRTSGAAITIAPDYDMDGISAGILGLAGLAELGFDVYLQTPDYRRGHDLTVQDVQEIATLFPQTSVLLTCDSGINSHAGITAAKDQNWLTLVTDHHTETEPGCNADLAVNPCRLDDDYPFKGICGAHVLWMVLKAYADRYAPHKAWEIHLLRLFAGLGTVADVMPLIHQNRALVRDSLSIARLLWTGIPRPYGPNSAPEPDLIDPSKAVLPQLLATDDHHPAFLQAFSGFGELLKALAIAGKIRDIDDINEGLYGFYIAPAMNSPRRINGDLSSCFEVFTAPSADRALAAAQRVLDGNEERKAATTRFLADLEATDQPLEPWVYFSDAPTGMFGLLANQMSQRHGQPVVVMSRPTNTTDPLSGSARAPGWFDIIDTLAPLPGLRAAGHQQACGVYAQNISYLDDLVQALAGATALVLTDPQLDRTGADLLLGPLPEADADLEDLEPLFEFARRTAELRPFGHGFTEPVLELAIDPSTCKIAAIGSAHQHLRLTTRSGLSVLWWNAAQEHLNPLRDRINNASRHTTDLLRFTTKLSLNTFRDTTRVQATVQEQLN